MGLRHTLLTSPLPLHMAETLRVGKISKSVKQYTLKLFTCLLLFSKQILSLPIFPYTSSLSTRILSTIILHLPLHLYTLQRLYVGDLPRFFFVGYGNAGGSDKA